MTRRLSNDVRRPSDGAGEGRLIDRPGNYGNAGRGRREDRSRPAWAGPRRAGAGRLLCIRFAYADSEPPLIPSLWGGSTAPQTPHHVGPAPHGLPHGPPSVAGPGRPGPIAAWGLNLLNSPSSFICRLWEAQDCRRRCCL